MNTLSVTARLIASFAAAAITFSLLATVYAIAEPQRGQLMAKLHPADQATASVTVAMAATHSARAAK